MTIASKNGRNISAGKKREKKKTEGEKYLIPAVSATPALHFTPSDDAVDVGTGLFRKLFFLLIFGGKVISNGFCLKKEKKTGGIDTFILFCHECLKQELCLF